MRSNRRNTAFALALSLLLAAATPALAAGGSSKHDDSLVGKAWSWVIGVFGLSEDNGAIMP